MNTFDSNNRHNLATKMKKKLWLIRLMVVSVLVVFFFQFCTTFSLSRYSILRHLNYQTLKLCKQNNDERDVRDVAYGMTTIWLFQSFQDSNKKCSEKFIFFLFLDIMNELQNIKFTHFLQTLWQNCGIFTKKMIWNSIPCCF